MFQGAKSFTENIWRWDTHKVRSMNRMFHNATKFAGSLCWPLHPDMVAVQTFCGSNHAGFQASCDIQHVLQSDINQKFHDCCSCEYSADEHYAHIEDDDDDNGSDSALDKKMGIILTSCIWVLVLVMLVVVIVFATPKRRHQVRHWLQINVMKSSTEEAPEQTRPRRRRREGSNSSGNNGNNYPSPALAPDGGVIATLVGPATTAHPRTPSNDGVTDTDTDIDRMVSTEIPNNNNHHNYDHNNDDSEVVVVDADHVQREEEVTTLSSPPWWIPDRNNVGTSSSTNNNDSSSSSNWVHAAATTVELPYDEEADLEKYNGMSLMC